MSGHNRKKRKRKSEEYYTYIIKIEEYSKNSNNKYGQLD
jgi:hypothetical protein